MPAHNEEHRIDRTLRTYREALADPGVRFWVALDGCEDRTADVVARHAAEDPRVGLVDYPKLGKGGVLTEALRMVAGSDAAMVGFVDADGATPPDELMRLAQVVEAGADGAIASRRHPTAVIPGGRSLARRLTSAGFAFLIRRVFDVRCHDTQCGAKVMRADVMDRLAPLLSARDFLFDVDLLHTANRLGYSIAEVPTVWVDQAGSRVRAGRDTLRMLGSSLALWLHHRMMPVSGHRHDVVATRPPRALTEPDLAPVDEDAIAEREADRQVLRATA